MWKEKSVRNFLIIMLVIIILFFASLYYFSSFDRLFVHTEAPSVGNRSLPNGPLAVTLPKHWTALNIISISCVSENSLLSRLIQL